jgi:hypothetical protein
MGLEQDRPQETPQETNNDTAHVTWKHRFVIGGMGALLPTALNLVQVDARILLVGFSVLVFFGYCIKSSILFAIGGCIAALNKGENNWIKLLQFGIGAPAVILSLANGSNIPRASSAPTAMSFSLVSEAYASEPEPKTVIKGWEIKRFSLNQSPLEQVFRGLSNRYSGDLWYIIAEQDENLEIAIKKAEAAKVFLADKKLLAENEKDQYRFTVSIYEPTSGIVGFSVVLGENLNQERVSKLSIILRDAGVPSKMWNLVCRCYYEEGVTKH